MQRLRGTWMDKDAFQLRPEIEFALMVRGKIQRLDAHAIAGQK